MRVLIVGCGYFGLPLGAELVRLGHEVHGLRRSHVAPFELQTAGIKPLTADITQTQSLARVPAAYDWVVHCVSSSGGTAEDYHQVYLEGTRNLLAWFASAPPQKLVYTSSTSVYGQNDGSLVDETSPTEPEAATARILVQTEKVLLQAVEQTGLCAIILRTAGIYGPGRGFWLQQYLQGEARIEGQGDRLLNMIHRDDLAGAAIAALERGEPGRIYNVVDDEPVSQLALFQWLARKLGRQLPPSVPVAPDAGRKRGVTNKKVSNRRLRTELGCALKYPTFREGFETELGRLEQKER